MKILVLLLVSSLAIASEPEVCFTPGGSCQDVVVAQLDAAKTSAFIMAYSFTSRPIALAIVAAAKRGVHVEVVLDRSNVHARYSGLPMMVAEHVDTVIDSSHAISHNKVMIIDEATVLTGSFNFTTAAQRHNAENLVVLHDPELAGLYLANFRKHSEHSRAP